MQSKHLKLPEKSPVQPGETPRNYIITAGDPDGIGYELIIKSLKTIRSRSKVCIIVGSARRLRQHGFTVTRDITLDKGAFVIDVEDAMAGLSYIEKATELVSDAPDQWIMITLPVSKSRISRYSHNFTGHTDYFRQKFGVKLLMTFAYEKLLVSLLTEHIPIKDVAGAISADLISDNLSLAGKYLKRYFGIDKPTIAISGLNPHCGDNGLVGTEETMMRESIAKLADNRVSGPYSVEYLLRKAFRAPQKAVYDLIFFCYHDQILPAMKMLYPQCVNMTLGLPFLRFSPSHGPALDIAGKGACETSSFEYIFEYASKLPRGG